MGVDLGELFPKTTCSYTDFSGRIIAIDAYNVIHQFLAIIRQQDGTPLKDANGHITSHLSGLFFRTSNLVEAGIKPVYVFDGKPHLLKARTIDERRKRRLEAETAYQAALAAGDLATAKSKASQTSRMTDDILTESKELLHALGIPYVQAPSEGEAQASVMVQHGNAYAVGSQDFDCLLFGTPLLIRNLTSSERRKLPGKQAYVKVLPELLRLDQGLTAHSITREQLVDIAIMLGTDFNDGIKGYGPKKSLTAIKEHSTLEHFLQAHPDITLPLDEINLIRSLFLQPQITTDYTLKWTPPDTGKVKQVLCEEHQFSESRVTPALEKFQKAEYLLKQRNLFDF
jgi:flap endonuclease-1